MAFVERRGPGRWRARYRGLDGKERSKTFDRQSDAKRWLTSVEGALARGEWVDPLKGRVTVGVRGREWLARKSTRLKPSTLEDYRSLLETCILPTWEHVPLVGVVHSRVDDWIANLTKRMGPSRVRKAHVVLSSILDEAVKDGALARNPAQGVDLPRLPARDHRYLTHAEVRSLAEAAGDYSTLIWVLATCGLRFGEAAALRASSVDLLRNRLMVRESVSEIGGKLIWGTPKSNKVREVPVPKFLRDLLEEQMAGLAPGDLLFTSPDGEVLRDGNFRRRTWQPALKKSGLSEITPHDLRHTAASLAVDAGANPLVVQRMLGHANPSTTLNVYSGLFDESLDALSSRLDAAFSGALAASARPAASETVIRLPLDKSETGV
jgi:integrase